MLKTEYSVQTFLYVTEALDSTATSLENGGLYFFLHLKGDFMLQEVKKVCALTI